MLKKEIDLYIHFLIVSSSSFDILLGIFSFVLLSLFSVFLPARIMEQDSAISIDGLLRSGVWSHCPWRASGRRCKGRDVNEVWVLTPQVPFS